jgi:REP element-mobilizing transposase RayT
MARPRKRHIQQELDLRDPEKDRRGGKRKGAGRPPKGPRSSEKHKRRPKVDARNPLHITLRAVAGLGSLRKRDVFHAIGDATVAVLKHEDFHIVHLSIQSNHVHLIVEAASKKALSRGMKAFQISAAKRINRALRLRTGKRRKGQVFADRYNARALTSPRAVRHALCYVLNNWRHHDEDQRNKTRDWKVDPYSSAIAFPDWKEREESPILYRPPPTYLGLVTWRARTWLLREGWKRHGLISIHEVPGEPRR